MLVNNLEINDKVEIPKMLDFLLRRFLFDVTQREADMLVHLIFTGEDGEVAVNKVFGELI